MTDCIHVLGAGGHAKVVISTLRAAGLTVSAAHDDRRETWGTRVLGVPVAGALKGLELAPGTPAVAAIGNNGTRREVVNQFPDLKWVTAVHPLAFVDPTVHLGPGTVVFAGAAVQPDTEIGAHCIVNTGATVDHDCSIGAFSHVAPGCHLAGGVSVGEGAFLGIGSAVVPGISIGAWSTVGAGATVLRDVSARCTAVGTPARERP